MWTLKGDKTLTGLLIKLGFSPSPEFITLEYIQGSQLKKASIELLPLA